MITLVLGTYCGDAPQRTESDDHYQVVAVAVGIDGRYPSVGTDRAGRGEGSALTIGGDFPRLDGRLWVRHEGYESEAQSTAREPSLHGVSNVDEQTAGKGVADGEWIEGIICSYPWPCAEAIAVARCESSLDPQAVGGGNYGLFQVNAVHAGRVRGDLRSLLEPHTNTSVAYDIWLDNAGWGPWACRSVIR